MALNVTPIAGADIVCFGHEAVTVATTSIGFTAGTITPTTAAAGSTRPAHRAVVTAETAQMRYRYDGTDPTASTGHLLDVGDVLVVEGIVNVQTIRFIRTGATSGTITCSYERFS